MFIGHHAIGFASKPYAPKVSLGWLMAAPLLPDLLCGLYIVLGWEHPGAPLHQGPFLRMGPGDYPWSHSLLTNVIYALVFSSVYFTRSKDRKGALILAIGVLSHWVLDVVTHLPDVPIVPGGEGFGLRLWASFWGSLIVEGSLFAASVFNYFRCTQARDRFGHLGAIAFVAFLVAIYVSYLSFSGPSNPRVLGALGVFSTLLFFYVHAFDAHRVART